MSTYAADRAFAAELAPLCERRRASAQRLLAQKWTRRAIALVADVCRREGLVPEAERIESMPVVDTRARATIVSTSLYTLALHIDHLQAMKRSEDVAIMVLAARNCAELAADEAFDDEFETERLVRICVRLRQIARAARCLDAESTRMFVDLADA